MSLRDWMRSLLRPPAEDEPHIRIVRQVREGVDLEFNNRGRKFHLEGELTGPRWKQMNIRIPDQGWDEQLLDDLTLALRRQGHEFVLFAIGKEQPVSASEQQSALAELQSMGYDVDVSEDRRRLKQELRPDAVRPTIEEARVRAPRLMKLIETVRGVRRPTHILRKSDSALI